MSLNSISNDEVRTTTLFKDRRAIRNRVRLIKERLYRG